MFRSAKRIAFFAAVATVAMVGSANAAGITWNFSSYGAAPLPVGETTVVTFDNANANGYTYTTSGATGIFNGANGLVSGIAAPPATGPATTDQTLFEAVQTGGELDLKTPDLSKLSVYIGSLDAYNEITFEGPGGFSQSFTGAQLQPPSDGDQSSGATNGRFDFNFGGQEINQVLFQSSGNSFEFDNISAGAVPEPATWAMMLGGVGMLGGMLRNGRRSRAMVAA